LWVSHTILIASWTVILPSSDLGGLDQLEANPKPHFPIMSRANWRQKEYYKRKNKRLHWIAELATHFESQGLYNRNLYLRCVAPSFCSDHFPVCLERFLPDHFISKNQLVFESLLMNDGHVLTVRY
jgi:hypothetical protein